MSSNGPYKSGPIPQWWLEKVYEDQMRQHTYMQNNLNNYDNTPDVYIIGHHYNGKTGKRIYEKLS